MVQLDELVTHRPRDARIQGKALPRVVGRAAQTPQLAHNLAATFLFPLPHPLEELFTPQVMPGQAFFFEVALHQNLSGNARVVGSGQVQRLEARHTLVANQGINDGVHQRGSQVHTPGHVGRRHHDGEGRLATGGVCAKGFGSPFVGPARLEGLGFVGFGQFIHGFTPVAYEVEGEKAD